MTKFKHACFVRVDDAEQRKELIGWLEMVGYENAAIIHQDNYWNIVANDLFPKQPLNWNKLSTPRELEEIGYIDCGTNIKLFKSITAINGDNDYMQWFISEEVFSQGIEVFGIGTCFQLAEMKFDNSIKAHKATPEELIEKFNDKRYERN